MKLIIDTSVIIDYLRTKRAESPYMKLREGNEFVLSLLTVAELFSGKNVQKVGPEREMLEEIINGTQIVIPTIKSVKEAGFLRAKYNLSLGDAFIAALALSSNLPLATLDNRDFGRIRGLKLYKLT